jgi:hypothetical protein
MYVKYSNNSKAVPFRVAVLLLELQSSSTDFYNVIYWGAHQMLAEFNFGSYLFNNPYFA